MKKFLSTSLFLFCACTAFHPSIAHSQETEVVSEEAPKEESGEAPKEESGEATDPEEAPEPPTAEEVSEKSDATAETASLMAQAIEDKNWALLIGLILSLLVSFANRFGLKDKVGGKALPWVTSGVAVAGAIGAALVGGLPIMEAASQGLLAGVAAIGGWEMVLKHVLSTKKAESDNS